ncbi:MAG TPA: HPr(Ser) kinase/phosphatase [Candidatus Borkfalkia excrementavium]|uniref:HPr kinase/phosphorylase n=1 Tax=Candidatus Borkfalkia excrementavium TaxID=2838505 RepID=A0A9D1Z704_9FIRM|nr:HPr(Ser) kinase/phosphatase [Candidatus Borkfalkia excrementavium]
MNEQETILLENFCGDLGLEIVFAGRGRVTLSSYSVTRPGLQLAGFFKYFDSSRILVFGNSEYEFLRDLSQEVRSERIKTLLSYRDIPCIILARDLPVLHELIEEARLTGCPILRTDRVTTALMNDLFFYLNKKLAPSTTMHGVLMDVSGVGILLTGHSGIGKSETAMELIKRGHRLVADDSVIVKRVSETLVGTSPETIRYFMELRGIGIINIKNMYGSGSILNEKEIELVIELENWVEGKEYDRLGEGTLYENILGLKVLKHVVPVKPGRNLSIIIEVAARNFRLKSMGYDAAQELIGRTIGR